MNRAAVVLASCVAWLVACDVTLRFEADASVDGRAGAAMESGPCAAGDDACSPPCSDAGCGSDATCSGNGCSCPPPTSSCSGSCFNLKSDHNHCGECTRACSNGEHCSAGVCIVGNGADGG